MTMQQPSLFDDPAEAPARRPPNVALVRKHLLATMRMMRAAEILPWHNADAAYWEQNFPILARLLPQEEGEPLIADFEIEIARLKSPK